MHSRSVANLLRRKDRILDASLHLFNRQGIDKVSARNICTQIGISPGNFSYHYPDKDLIVADLFDMMVREAETALTAAASNDVTILTYLGAHKQLFLIQNKFKFFYLNLFEILNRFPTIRSQFRKKTKAEAELAHNLIQVYMNRGVLREDIPEDQVKRLITVGQILNNAWLMDAEVQFTGNEKKKLRYYMAVCCGLLEPYLNQPSLAAYNDYFANL